MPIPESSRGPASTRLKNNVTSRLGHGRRDLHDLIEAASECSSAADRRGWSEDLV